LLRSPIQVEPSNLRSPTAFLDFPPRVGAAKDFISYSGRWSATTRNFGFAATIML